MAALPDDAIELATLDTTTYVSTPDAAVLPSQPAEITLTEVVLDAPLRTAIKTASPHCRVISEQMIEKIRNAYTIDDEMFYARIGVGAATGMYVPTADEMQDMQVFGEFVEGVRQWGRNERAKLGL